MIKELFKLRHDMELLDYLKSTCHSTERGIVLRLIAGLYQWFVHMRLRKYVTFHIARMYYTKICNATITRVGLILKGYCSYIMC